MKEDVIANLSDKYFMFSERLDAVEKLNKKAIYNAIQT
jgi:hypothetical protein